MSGTSWLLFKSPKEARRCEKYLAPLGGWVGIEGKWCCWLGFNKGKRLDIDHNAGSLRSGVHDFVQREICRRFDVLRIGACSVGWYKDSSWTDEGELSAKECYPGFSDWISWAKAYKPEWSSFMPKRKYWDPATFEAAYAKELAFHRKVEKFIEQKFKELDQCAEST